jgi:hypothetical protein
VSSLNGSSTSYFLPSDWSMTAKWNHPDKDSTETAYNGKTDRRANNASTYGDRALILVAS